MPTNAVRRCSALYPGYATVAERVDAPLAILEVGSSAGLNLNWDRYRYAYRTSADDAEDAGGGVRERVVGNADAPFVVETDVRGDGRPPLPRDPPAVARRVGVDVNPLDPTDPADAPLVVAHSLVLYQFDDAAREAFHDAVADLARSRDAPPFHLAGERPDPERDHGIQLRLARVDATDSDRYLGDGGATDSDRSPGDADADRLGTFEQHGAWVAWRDPTDQSTAATDAPRTIHDREE